MITVVFLLSVPNLTTVSRSFDGQTEAAQSLGMWQRCLYIVIMGYKQSVAVINDILILQTQVNTDLQTNVP
jgi:hypothetical protein